MTFDEIKTLLEAARKEVSDLCKGERRWTMHLPARKDDSDLLIGGALRTAEKLLAVVEAARDFEEYRGAKAQLGKPEVAMAKREALFAALAAVEAYQP